MGLGRRERGVILKRAPEKTAPPRLHSPFTQAAFETKKKPKPSQAAPCAIFTV